MKKICKIVSIILCAVMLSTSVFASKANAQTMYKKALDNITEAGSFKITGTMKTTLITGFDMIYNFTLLIKYDKDGNPSAILNAKDKKTIMAVNAYYKDGYLYTEDALGEKTKTKLSKSKFLELFPSNLGQTSFGEKIEETDKGQRISLSVPKKSTISLLNGVLEPVASSSLSIASEPLKNTKYYYVIDGNKSFVSQSIGYTNVITGMKHSISMKYSQIGKVKDLVFPEDLSSYKTK